MTDTKQEIDQLAKFVDKKAWNMEFWDSFNPLENDKYFIEFSGLALNLEAKDLLNLLKALKTAIEKDINKD